MTNDPFQLAYRPLGSRTRAYIRDMLGLDTIFCRSLVASVDLAGGEVFAYLPRGLPADAAEEFAWGGLLERSGGGQVPRDVRGFYRTETPKQRLVTEVQHRLRVLPNNCLIADDAQDTYAASPAHGDAEPCAFHVGDELYRVATAHDSAVTIADVLNAGNWIWHGLAALCRPAYSVSTAALSDAGALAACLATVQELYAVAYDGEAYVVWRR